MEEEEVALEGASAQEYRALVARLNYLAMDRADIQYSVKEVCRAMSKPTVGDKRKLKRIARYLVGRPRAVWKYPWQEECGVIDVFSDSNWAGCSRTARSTSGGVVMRGGHGLKSWSTTQKNVTLSSGEAELVAAVKAAAEGIGIARLAHDWGDSVEVAVHVDSSAAIGVINRRGSGKLRHIKVGHLWIQEMAEEGEIRVRKVLGDEDPADLMTKHFVERKVSQFMQAMGFEFRHGRADTSLQLTS